jgi:hypothetical protein
MSGLAAYLRMKSPIASMLASRWLGVRGRPTIRRIGCCIGSTSKLMAGNYVFRPGGSISAH